MKRLIVVTIIIAIPSIAFSYEGTPKDQIALFFKDIAAGKFSEAFDNLYSNNPIVSQKTQQMTLIKQKFATVATVYGSFLVSENIHYEKLSPSLIRIVQLAKHELHPIIWEFYFYKPRDNWMINQSKFVDQFQVIGTKK